MRDATLAASTPSAGRESDLRHGSATFIGTATVLIRFAGITILTDPNFLHQGEQVHLGYGLRSTRRTNPAVEMDALPPVDLVLLSHLHEDHFDRKVARRLSRSLPIFTTPQAAAALCAMGFQRVHALRTWQTLQANRGDAAVQITAMPAIHAHGPLGKLLPPVMGSMLEFHRVGGPTVLRLYITGDTLLHDALREVPRRYPSIDLALLHLGGTRIFGVLLTMDACQGVEALRIVAPRTAIPIHYDDYTVFKSPLADFQRAVAQAGLADRVRYLDRGDTYTFEVPG